MDSEKSKNAAQIIPRFIVFEGIDGSGTTTQTDMLVRALQQTERQVHATFEPTDSSIGILIRNILNGSETVCSSTMARLFAADRCEHVFAPEVGLIDRYRRGEWIVSDRYVFSSLAYQGPLVGFDTVLQLNKGFPLPQWVFHLSLSGTSAMNRISHRKSFDIYENTEFQDKVSAAYQHAYNLFDYPDTEWVELDATESPAEIHERVCTLLGISPIQSM
ncbi:MAG: dTMP kinase [Spirochaeta sp.]